MLPVDGRPSRNPLSLYFAGPAIKGDDCAWVLRGPSNVPRVPEGDRDFLVLLNVTQSSQLSDLLSALVAFFRVPEGVGLYALYRSGWR